MPDTAEEAIWVTKDFGSVVIRASIEQREHAQLKNTSVVSYHWTKKFLHFVSSKEDGGMRVCRFKGGKDFRITPKPFTAEITVHYNLVPNARDQSFHQLFRSVKLNIIVTVGVDFAKNPFAMY